MGSTDIDSPDFDPHAFVEESMARAAQRTAEKRANSFMGKTMQADRAVHQYVQNLPGNISAGLVTAFLNTADNLNKYDEWFTTPADYAVANAKQGKLSTEPTPLEPLIPKETLEPIRRFRDWMAEGKTGVSDEITQGLAGFAVPYAGFAKVFGLASGAGALTSAAAIAGADVASAVTIQAPHDGRMADLADLARHSHGKWADLLHTVAPDGSLANRYIDWMTARDGETDAEGYFKNAVDNLVSSAVPAALIKAGAGTFRAARHLLGYGAEVPAAAPAAVAAPAAPAAAPAVPAAPAAATPKAPAPGFTFSAPETSPVGVVRLNTPNPDMAHEYVHAGSQVIRAQRDGADVGFIAFHPTEDGKLQINRTKLAPEVQSQGAGQSLLLQALDTATQQGKPLVSDNTVTGHQLRVYAALERKGEIKVTYADPAKVKAALAKNDPRVVVKAPGSGPLVTSIERITPGK
jgi:predicted GNAT family acetyltransferase